mgnify:CR=1 FL=1
MSGLPRGRWRRLDGPGTPPATAATDHPCQNGHVHICRDCSRVTRCCWPECKTLVHGRCVGYCPVPRVRGRA